MVESGSLEISGVVVDDAGSPVPHVTVFMSSRGPYGNRDTRTDDEGTFRFRRLPDKYKAEAVRLHPDFAEGHNNLGNALAALGRTDEAIGHYRAALEINPSYAEARSNLEAVSGGK